MWLARGVFRGSSGSFQGSFQGRQGDCKVGAAVALSINGRDEREERDKRDERDERDNNEVEYHLSLRLCGLCGLCCLCVSLNSLTSLNSFSYPLAGSACALPFAPLGALPLTLHAQANPPSLQPRKVRPYALIAQYPTPTTKTPLSTIVDNQKITIFARY